MDKQKLDNHVIKPEISLTHNEIEHRLIPVENELSLDSKIDKIQSFIKFNHGFGRSEENKDELYDEAKQMWQSFAKELKDVVYNFYINEEQHSYLLNLLNNELEYDANTIFFAMELVKLLGEWAVVNTPSEAGLSSYLADATETTYIYHLISKHKVKGLNNEAKLFSEILLRIGEISKIVSYYDTHAKSLSKEIQDWVASFDEPINSSFTPPINLTPTF